ncbi:hypothetical protein EJ02DRAFT_369446 [Clathrospora elynae]|uniref:Uncharacterized protein n=1 Tax=Clathrospora elynae TaxID=706981 RepID=A0A6A5SZT3_9PLEO|nr:hypothetical protein EJ02DRAFT_369446 [Clathrospora elynae]
MSEMSVSDAPVIPPPATYLGELDPTVVGIGLVLALESPCLGHIDVAHSDHDPKSTGHALTVSASLLHHSPNPSGRRLESVAAWEVSGLGIKRLSEFSQAIPLMDGEVTPVQAWDYIRKQAQYENIEVERMETLKEKLVGHVRCYGFGGVIERGVFENSVFEAFVVGRVF